MSILGARISSRIFVKQEDPSPALSARPLPPPQPTGNGQPVVEVTRGTETIGRGAARRPNQRRTSQHQPPSHSPTD